MRIPEEEGLHFRPSSSHCGYALRNALSGFGNVFRFVSIEELAGIDMLCFDKKDTLTKIIMFLVSKFLNVKLQSKNVCC